MNFQTAQQTPIHSQVSGGIRFAIYQFGEGELAYYRLTAGGGQVDHYSTLNDAKAGIETYMKGRNTANDRRKVKDKSKGLKLW